MNSGWSFFGARATKVIVSTSRQYNASLNTCKKSRQLEEEKKKKQLNSKNKFVFRRTPTDKKWSYFSNLKKSSCLYFKLSREPLSG